MCNQTLHESDVFDIIVLIRDFPHSEYQGHKPATCRTKIYIYFRDFRCNALRSVCSFTAKENTFETLIKMKSNPHKYVGILHVNKITKSLLISLSGSPKYQQQQLSLSNCFHTLSRFRFSTVLEFNWKNFSVFFSFRWVLYEKGVIREEFCVSYFKYYTYIIRFYTCSLRFNLIQHTIVFKLWVLLHFCVHFTQNGVWPRLRY